jgi:uncharacterized lipoprotein YmbA
MNTKKTSQKPPIRVTLLLFLTAMAFLVTISGCFQGKPVHRYTLTPATEAIRTAATPDSQSAPQHTELIVIGPVKLTSYLDQSRIIKRQGTTTINAAADQQWAGELSEMISNSLITELGIQLHPVSIHAYPMSTPLTHGKRVALDILRFEGTETHTATIEARWTIFDLENRAIIASHSTLLHIPATDDSYEALITALSTGLAQLGKEIAASFP